MPPSDDGRRTGDVQPDPWPRCVFAECPLGHAPGSMHCVAHATIEARRAENAVTVREAFAAGFKACMFREKDDYAGIDGAFERWQQRRERARLDVDGTAIPKTQLRGVVANQVAEKRGAINENQVEGYVLKDTTTTDDNEDAEDAAAIKAGKIDPEPTVPLAEVERAGPNASLARDVTCPRCGVGPGERCFDKGRGVPCQTHEQRKAATPTPGDARRGAFSAGYKACQFKRHDDYSGIDGAFERWAPTAPLPSSSLAQTELLALRELACLAGVVIDVWEDEDRESMVGEIDRMRVAYRAVLQSQADQFTRVAEEKKP